jgi:hypothetical protein
MAAWEYYMLVDGIPPVENKLSEIKRRHSKLNNELRISALLPITPFCLVNYPSRMTR